MDYKDVFCFDNKSVFHTMSESRLLTQVFASGSVTMWAGLSSIFSVVFFYVL